jgi:hypothetical protein
VGLFEPVTGEKYHRVDTFDGDEYSEPESCACTARERIVQHFTADDRDERMREVNEKSKIDLIDHAQTEQIMSHSIAKTSGPSESDKAEEIGGYRYEKCEVRQDDQQGTCSPLQRRRYEIGVEKLIESEGEGFGSELTSSTRVTRRRETHEIIRLIVITSQTSIQLVIVEKTFDMDMIRSTDAQVGVIKKTECLIVLTTGADNHRWRLCAQDHIY